MITPDESVMESLVPPGSSPLLDWSGGGGAQEDRVLHLPLHLPLAPAQEEEVGEETTLRLEGPPTLPTQMHLL